MSDFDDVLERLLFDEGFKAALAADPARALAGYDLSPDEVELLQTQVSTDTGGERQVEQRTSKASMFGLLSSFGGLGHVGDSTSHAGHGAAAASAGLGAAGGPEAGHAGLGAAGQAGFGAAGQAGLGESGRSGFSEAGWQEWSSESDSTFEARLDSAGGDLGVAQAGTAHIGEAHSGGSFGAIGEQLSDLVHGGQGQGGQVHEWQSGAEAPEPPAPPVPPPADYHPHIDVDGDGRWDAYTVQGRADGGVDVVADMDHDGRPDFIGHDLNRDGLIDSADYDKDHDGVFENHQFDTNGDGWLDKTVVDPKPAPAIPPSVAEELRFRASE